MLCLVFVFVRYEGKKTKKRRLLTTINGRRTLVDSTFTEYPKTAQHILSTAHAANAKEKQKREQYEAHYHIPWQKEHSQQWLSNPMEHGATEPTYSSKPSTKTSNATLLMMRTPEAKLRTPSQ
jgi:hypothetical protein